MMGQGKSVTFMYDFRIYSKDLKEKNKETLQTK